MRSTVASFAQPIRSGFRRCVERRVPLAVGLYGVFAATLLEVSEAFRITDYLGRDGYGLMAVILLCGLPVVAVLQFMGKRPRRSRGYTIR